MKYKIQEFSHIHLYKEWLEKFDGEIVSVVNHGGWLIVTYNGIVSVSNEVTLNNFPVNIGYEAIFDNINNG
jgi:hypothetical protein